MMLSDSVRTRRFVLVLLCCTTLVLLGLMSSLVLTAHATSFRQEVHASPLTAQGAPRDCPDARTMDPKGDPVLDFCSPKYAGNVNGLVGSHIVLLGQNFPGQPTAWLLTQNQAINQQDVQNCIPTPTNCADKVLPKPLQSKPIGKTAFEFLWTWTATDFPITPGAYFFVADLGQKNSSKLVVSSVSFTLTSASSPCITVNSGNGGANCSQPQSITLTSGSSLTLQGSNWLLKTAPSPPTQPPTPEVVITIKCAASPCSQNLLSQPLTIPLEALGTFSRTVVLAQNVAGKYTLCASYQVQNAPPPTQVATPGQDFNTVILNTSGSDLPFDGSLTFGCKGDTTALILTVKPQPVPPPISTFGKYENVLDIASYAGIVLAIPILLLCLYFFLQGRQASPQAMGTAQQKSPSGVLVNNNALLPTPQNMTTTADRRVTANNQDAVKRAVGELVQGNPNLAVQLAKQALTSNRVQWNILLQAIEKAPRAAPANVGDLALSSLKQAKQDKQNELEHICKALILYRWFINTRLNSPAVADCWYIMGRAYDDLSSIVPTMSFALLTDALACYRIALSIYQPQSDRDSCFAASRNMGDVYLAMSSLPESDQQVYLYAALSYYQDARSLTRDQKRKQEIQARISRVEKELRITTMFN